MLRYVDTKVTFFEIPDEISLCINISGCSIKCKDCHSSYLWSDIGKPLNWGSLNPLIYINTGITCVCFMGGDSDIKTIENLAHKVKTLGLKVGWYSGRDTIPSDMNLNEFDFIKIGPYIKDRGPLNCRTTNQIMFSVVHNRSENILKDITYKFWTNAEDNK